jgi:3-oxoacyl-[acyl-carrier-protein] synthase-3
VGHIGNINSVITGTGAYLPDFVLDNGMFNQIIETSDEWIVSRTGIKERRIEQEKYNFEMIGEACKCAIENAGLTPDKIDMIIVSTITPDYNYPATACLVQNYIQACNAASFDISAACAGFVFALDTADAYIKSGKAKNILVASGDIVTRTVDYFDRNNCILFGDGAGAVVVSACGTDSGIMSSYINCESDGQKPYFLYQRLYEPFEIFDKETKQFKGNIEKIHNSYIWQNGREVMQFVSKVVPKALDEVLGKINKKISDLKYIILHQANKRIIDHVIEKYNLDPEKVPISIDKYGNTSSSTIPILLHELNIGNKINKGDLVALVGFGSGFAYGAAVVRW